MVLLLLIPLLLLNKESMDENKELQDVVQEEVVEQVAQPVEQPQEENLETRLADTALNVKTLRKRLEAQEEIARQEAYARRQAEIRAAELEQRYHQPTKQTEDDLGDDEDYVPVKKLKKYTSKQTESEKKLADLEQKLAYLEAKAETDSLKDFQEVVTTENLQTLQRLYPDDFEVLQSNNNLRARAKTAYNMIKRYGIVDATPVLKQVETMKAVEKRIEANKSKPASSAAAAPSSSSPLTKYGRYDESGRLILTEADRDKINKDVRQKMMMG